METPTFGNHYFMIAGANARLIPIAQQHRHGFIQDHISSDGLKKQF
jgi:hypothetical protein